MKRSATMPNNQGFSGHVLGLEELYGNDRKFCFDSDGSSYHLMIGSQLVSEIRAAVEKETGFRCSSGIATNKMLAKLVSSLNKPNQQTCILESAVAGFLMPLSVRRLPGIGHQTECLLKDMGIATVADLQKCSLLQLADKFGSRLGTILYNSCRGVDNSPIQDKGPPKSLSVEDSFQPCTSLKHAEEIIKSLAPDLIARLDEDKEEYLRRPRTFTIKWRYPGSWAFKSSSAIMPDEILSASVSMEKRLETVVESGMKLLSQSFGKQSFSIVVLNIGATGFTDISNGSNCASHDIRSFLGSSSKFPQESSSKKVVSKREARINREECERGPSNKLIKPLLGDTAGSCIMQDLCTQDYLECSLEQSEDVCEVDLHEDGCSWTIHNSPFVTEQSDKKLELRASILNDIGAFNVDTKQKSSKHDSEAGTDKSSSGTRYMTATIQESGGSVVRKINCAAEPAVDYTPLSHTVADKEFKEDFGLYICESCGQEVYGDAQTKQEHDDYHYALKLNSQEQISTDTVTSKPTNSKYVALEMPLNHHPNNKRAKIQNRSRGRKSGPLDSFLVRSKK
ncbi:hypothetical protein KP509_37G026800 [Ceratopteris richardii]|nr:hypothetical protein KP509_37G026800 [Ceratopteris richardii]